MQSANPITFPRKPVKEHFGQDIHSVIKFNLMRGVTAENTYYQTGKEKKKIKSKMLARKQYQATEKKKEILHK